MKHLLLSALFLMSSAFAKVDPWVFDHLGTDTNFDLDLYDQINAERQGHVSIGPKIENRGAFIPFELDQASMVKIAAASSIALVFFANDREITEFVEKNDAQYVERLAYVGEAIGSEWGIGMVGAGYIIGVVMKNNQVKSVSILAAKAMIVSGLITQAIKYGVDRTRPRNGNNDPYQTGAGSHSFPSGHTTSAFALATVIAESTKDQGLVVPILAYSSAALAGWSRVYDRAHWASDVVIGGLIGHLTAKAMMNSKIAQKGFMITPEIDTKGNSGFRVNYTGKSDFKCGIGLEDVEAFRDCLNKSFR